MEYLRKATITGFFAAFFSLSAFGKSIDEGVEAYDQGDYTTAFENFTTLAEQGNVNAQLNLGYMYRNGEGVPQNYNEAVSWYRRAAEQGLAEAQSDLGAMYDTGKGVPQNYSEAVKWYRRAAEQGYALAQYNLGNMYWNGQGVTHSPIMSYVLAILAAAQGHEAAKKDRDISLEVLSREQIAEAQRMATKWRVGTPLPSSDDFTTWP